MPTAARLIAGICLALLGYAASQIIMTLMPASTNFGKFVLVNCVIGFLCGWVIVGSRAGRGQSAAVSNGLTGVIGLVFWGLSVQAINEMVERSLHRRYDGMLEAAGAAIELFIEFGEKMLDARLILTLLAGAIVTGFLTEIASKRWR